MKVYQLCSFLHRNWHGRCILLAVHGTLLWVLGVEKNWWSVTSIRCQPTFSPLHWPETQSHNSSQQQQHIFLSLRNVRLGIDVLMTLGNGLKTRQLLPLTASNCWHAHSTVAGRVLVSCEAHSVPLSITSVVTSWIIPCLTKFGAVLAIEVLCTRHSKAQFHLCILGCTCVDCWGCKRGG